MDNCFSNNVVSNDGYHKEVKSIKEKKTGDLALCYGLTMEHSLLACDLDVCFPSDGVGLEIPEMYKVGPSGRSMSLGQSSQEYIIIDPDSFLDFQTAVI